jgi:cell wall-associated NlpC family hydrolase
MTAAVIAGAAVFAVAGPAAPAALTAQAAAATGQLLAAHHRAVPAVNLRIAAYAVTFVGRYPYHWGGTSPKTGFDCSGLTWYIYRHFGLALPRTAQQQSVAVHRVSRTAAMPGDLVFFHDRTGYVYHVGIYEGGGRLVAAADPAEGIVYEIIWTSAVTFGTLTH